MRWRILISFILAVVPSSSIAAPNDGILINEVPSRAGGLVPPPFMAHQGTPSTCAYADIISGLTTAISSAPRKSNEVRGSDSGPTPVLGPGDNIRDTPTLSDVIRQRKAQLEQSRSAGSVRSKTEIARLDGLINAVQKDVDLINSKTGTGYMGMGVNPGVPEINPRDQVRLVELTQEKIALNYQKQVEMDRANLDEIYYQRQLAGIEYGEDINPVMQSIYRHQEALVGSGSLRPLARELVSFAGFSVGGPAGLVAGSLVGNLLGGVADRIAKKISAFFNKADPKLEDILASLQEVCRWHEFSMAVTKNLTDPRVKELREKKRKDFLTALDRSEEAIACSDRKDLLRRHIESLDLFVKIVKNRIGAKKIKIDDAYKEGLRDLLVSEKFPKEIIKEVIDKLESEEANSIEAFLEALLEKKTNQMRVLAELDSNTLGLNRELLQNLRRIVNQNLGSFTPEQTNEIRQIYLAATMKLKTAELDLHARLRTVLDTEFKKYIGKIDATYKSDSALAQNLTNRAAQDYFEAMAAAHRRAIALNETESSLLPNVAARRIEAERGYRAAVEMSPFRGTDPALIQGQGGSSPVDLLKRMWKLFNP